MKKILFTLSLIFLFLAPSIFAETVPDIPAGTAEEYYNRGNQYRQQGNLDQAISDYTNAIRVYSKHAKAYYNRGNAYGKQGKLSQAIADYSKAIEINPKYYEAYYNLGNTYEKQGKLSQAIASYSKAIETNPQYAAAYCNRGNIYQAQGNFQKAIADYNKAAEINPNFAGVYSNRGNAYQAQGNLPLAIADYNKAIEINPNFAGFYSNRGNIYQTQGNLQMAIADYNKAIEKNPNDNSSLYNRGLAYYGIEQFEKSLADYTTAISQNPNKEAYEDFIKYFPEKRESDKGDTRKEIVQIFEEKLHMEKKTHVAIADTAAAPVVSAQSVPAVVPPAPVVAAASVPVTAAASALTDTNATDDTQNEKISTPRGNIQGVVNKWLSSWKTGNMETYRSCYDESDFQSRGMNLDEWITFKTNISKKSKNIKISIDNLKISVNGDNAKVVFTQDYSSSLIKSKGKKTLELKKEVDEWKIFREIM
jgi:tetratricopeptide (TPR) repeat protein